MWKCGLLLCLLTMGCQVDESNRTFHHKNIWVNSEIGSDPDFIKEDAAQMLSERTMEDLFEFENVVPLELLDASIVGEITDLLFHQDHWYILDQMTCGIYKFDAKGQFITRFGERGSGPGEFEYPKRIRACFDNLIGVTDPVQGRIHLFDTQGKFVSTTEPNNDGAMILPRYAFVWNQQDQLVISGFGSSNPQAPAHAVMDGRMKAYKLRFGFGERIMEIERALLKGSPNRAYTAFEEIDGRYWAGSPFTTYVDVFNRQGQFLGRLGNKGLRDRREMIHPEDYAGLDRQQNPSELMRGSLNQKRGNDNICQIGDYVFVRMGRIYDVYRKNGQRIGMNIKAKHLLMRYGYQNHLVMVIPAGIELEKIPESPLKKALINAGYDPQDNPYLAIFKLNQIKKVG